MTKIKEIGPFVFVDKQSSFYWLNGEVDPDNPTVCEGTINCLFDKVPKSFYLVILSQSTTKSIPFRLFVQVEGCWAKFYFADAAVSSGVDPGLYDKHLSDLEKNKDYFLELRY